MRRARHWHETSIRPRGIKCEACRASLPARLRLSSPGAGHERRVSGDVMMCQEMSKRHQIKNESNSKSKVHAVGTAVLW